MTNPKWFNPDNPFARIEQWGTYYLPHWFTSAPAEMHHDWFNAIEKDTRVAIAGPRLFAKSVCAHLVPGLYYPLEFADHDFLSVSNTPDLAELWVSRIEKELTYNEKILEDYPWLTSLRSKRATSSKPGWRVHQRKLLELPNGSTIMARGIFTAKRGLHPQTMVIDDLEDEEMEGSMVQREKCEKYFFGTLLGMDADKLIMIGNYLYEHCLLQKIIENKFADEEKRDLSAWTRMEFDGAPSEGESAWPSEWPWERLMAKRAEMGEDKFAAEFRNKPGTLKNKKFLREWVTYHLPQQLLCKPDDKLVARSDKFMVVDAASSMKAKADYRAWGLFMLVQRPENDFEKQLFCLDWDQNREHPRKVAKQVVDCIAPFGFNNVPIVFRTEEGGTSLWLQDEIRRECLALIPPRLPKIEPVSIPGNKMERWNDACAFYAGTPLSMPKNKNYGLVEQCVAFPNVKNDDCVDVVQVAGRYAELRIGRRTAGSVVIHQAAEDEILFDVDVPQDENVWVVPF